MGNIYKDVQKALDKQERDLTKERDDRCIPVARELLKLIAEYEEGMLLNTNPDKFRKSYYKLEDQILDMLRDKDMPIHDWGYIVKLALVPFDHLQAFVTDTLLKTEDAAIDAMWGKDGKTVTIKDLEEKLKDVVLDK